MSFNANANGRKIDPPLSKEEERLRRSFSGTLVIIAAPPHVSLS